MENSFPGYYRLKDADRARLWRDAFIVLDANTLLNLYRYSPSTRDNLLGLLHKLKPRLWLPHQVGLEFHENRHAVILEQTQAHKEILAALDAILQQLDDPRKHPFLAPSVQAKIDDTVKELKTALQSSHDALFGFLTVDPVCDVLTQIYEGRVGSPYAAEALEKLFKLGEERYHKLIPPGFEDRKKPEPEKFGDLILWMQLLDKAETTKAPFLLVTDDNKTDWWWRLKGQTFGPRPELKAEIMAKSGQPFHMYTCTRFMEHAKETLDSALKQSTIDEVRQASEARRKAFLFYQQRLEALLQDNTALRPDDATASSLAAYHDQIRALHREALAGSPSAYLKEIKALQDGLTSSPILEAMRRLTTASSFVPLSRDRQVTHQSPDAVPPQDPHAPPAAPLKTDTTDSAS